MLRYKNKIRLHHEDCVWLTQLTGTNPSGIQTVDDLNDYIDRHLAIIGDNTPESKLIGLLLAEEKILT